MSYIFLSLQPYQSRDFQVGSCCQQNFLFYCGECVHIVFLYAALLILLLKLFKI